MAKDRFIIIRTADIKLKLISTRGTDPRRYNLPTTSEVAALIVGDIDSMLDHRDIVLEKQGGGLQRINELHVSYLPLQYPLLFPFGEDGFKIDIPVSDVAVENRKRTRESRQSTGLRIRKERFRPPKKKKHPDFSSSFSGNSNNSFFSFGEEIMPGINARVLLSLNLQNFRESCQQSSTKVSFIRIDMRYTGGFAKSAMLAMLMPHLKVGAQKWTAKVANKQLIIQSAKCYTTNVEEMKVESINYVFMGLL
ncbi:hypothetical protein V2J09_012275 [Rumex salicifolius]